MAIIAQADNETGNLSEYSATVGTPTVVAPPSPQGYNGNFALLTTAATTNHRVSLSFTATTTVYIRAAIYVQVTTNPSVATNINFVNVRDTPGGTNLGYLQLQVSTAGVCQIQVVAMPGFAYQGSAVVISKNTWTIIEWRVTINATAGAHQFRLDAGSLLVNTTPATGSTSIGAVDFYCFPDAMNGIVASTHWDVIVIDDATFPGLPATYTWEQEGYRWRRDDGSETTATWIAAQDTPL